MNTIECAITDTLIMDLRSQEQSDQDPNRELKLRQVFIRRDDSLSRDCIRTLNVMRGQSKGSSIDATPVLLEKIRAALADNKSYEVVEKLYGGVDILCTKTPEDIFSAIGKYIAESAPITINIRPDVIKLLTADGTIKSAFEVNTKGVAYIKWRRDKEAGCFLGLYSNGTLDVDRPKYGALNFLNTPGGIPSARSYGKWQLVPKKSVRTRCTLAGENTHSQSDIGVLDFPAHILLKLTTVELLQLALIANGIITSAEKYEGTYREVQIHGTLTCERDIAELHVEKNDPDRACADEFARKYGITLCEY